MHIGLFATFMSPRADRFMIRDFAQQCESIGVHSVWMGEHVVLFDETEHPYPGAKDGKIPVPAGGGMLDTVATFGFLAGVTETLRFGTGIALISQRNPLYTAKEFATLDWLTGGRIDFGVGVGWCKEEVIASGYSWEDRGARSDEFLALTKVLWTDPLVSFEGEHFQLAPCHLDPKPLQTPHIPIIVGGRSDKAIERAARYGDGWLGVWCSPERFANVVEHIGETTDRSEPWKHGLQLWVGTGETKAEARTHVAKGMETFYQIPFERFEKYSPYGTAEEIAEYLLPFVENGARILNICPRGPSEEYMLEVTAEVATILKREHG